MCPFLPCFSGDYSECLCSASTVLCHCAAQEKAEHSHAGKPEMSDYTSVCRRERDWPETSHLRKGHQLPETPGTSYTVKLTEVGILF